MRTKIVHVKFKQSKTGLIFATSRELKGLLISERTMEAFETSIPAAITDLYASDGVQVVVQRAEREKGIFAFSVAFPTELVRRAPRPTS